MNQPTAPGHNPRTYRASTGEPTVTISVSVPLSVADWIARTAAQLNSSKSRVATIAFENEMHRAKEGQAA